LFAHGDTPAMARLFATMRRRGIVLDATNRVYEEGERAARRTGKPAYCTLALALRLTNQAWRAGVTISAGTDGETAAQDAWPAVIEEVELLGRAGRWDASRRWAASRRGSSQISQYWSVTH
jgi:hypothetical protein